MVIHANTHPRHNPQDAGLSAFEEEYLGQAVLPLRPLMAAVTTGSSKGEARGWLPLGAFNSLAAAAGVAVAPEGTAGSGGGGLQPEFPAGAAVAALVRIAVE